MIDLFEANADLFASWTVDKYEQEGPAYALHVSGLLIDGSRLYIRDYVFVDGNRKYAYQWLEPDGELRRRWDNASHWRQIATYPHHAHIPDDQEPVASTVTDLESLIGFLRQWFD